MPTWVNTDAGAGKPSWRDRLQLKPTGHCAEAVRRGYVPGWPGPFSPVPVPPPPTSPHDTSLQILAKHLAHAYRQAFQWSGHNTDFKAKFFVALTVLAHDHYALTRKMLGTIRQLRSDQSRLPLIVWAWWVVSRAYEKGSNGAAPQSVYNADRILDKRVRGFFWRDCGQGLDNQPSLWPIAAEKAYELVNDFTKMDAHVPDIATAAGVWDAFYRAEYERLLERARLQFNTIKDRVEKHVIDYDLGLWMTKDIPTYLKIDTIVSTRVG